MNSVYYAPMQSTMKFDAIEDNIQHIVGSYAKTILIRTGEDRYVPFKCDIVKIEQNDLLELENTVNNNKTRANIIIEENSKLFITRLASMLRDNFLIYYLPNKTCITIYEYVEKTFQIPPFKLNLHQIITLLNANILLTYCFINSSITWNAKLLIDTISDSNYELFYNVVQKYLQKTTKVYYENNPYMSRQLVNYIKKYFDKTESNSKFIIFPAKQVSDNDLYSAISFIASHQM